MENKKNWYIKELFCLMIVFLIMINFASAITGSIGNARMILRVTEGDTIEKYILVKNVNDVDVNIEISASGDLEENIKILDDNFTLEAGNERKAYFTIKVKEKGTTETSINIKFSPIEGKNGVGLSSTVIVIAKEKEGFNWWSGENNNSTNTNSTSLIDKVSSVNSGALFIIVLLIIFVILLIIFLVVLKKTKPKKEVHKE